MNYFGLMFTFMIPGVAMGCMLAATVVSARRASRRVAASKRDSAPAWCERPKRLCIYTLTAENDEGCRKAA